MGSLLRGPLCSRRGGGSKLPSGFSVAWSIVFSARCRVHCVLSEVVVVVPQWVLCCVVYCVLGEVVVVSYPVGSLLRGPLGSRRGGG